MGLLDEVVSDLHRSASAPNVKLPLRMAQIDAHNDAAMAEDIRYQKAEAGLPPISPQSRYSPALCSCAMYALVPAEAMLTPR